MIYAIENDDIQVKISSLGAEMMSIFNKENAGEYLWQGDESYWSGRAPVMFPICGRLYDGKYTYLGKEYTMPNHGIARASEFSLSSCSGDRITLTLKSSEETKKHYPFDFIFNVTFKLARNTLEITYEVKNIDAGDIIFAVGGHPAFNVPINNEGAFEDYYVEFGNACNAMRVDFSPKCFCTKDDKLFKQGGTKRIDLSHNLFDDDAIFLYNIDKTITLKSDKYNHKVRLKFERMKYVGLWHMPKTDAPYICIEPWSSIPANEGVVDNLLTKEEMIHLPSGYTYKNSYTITIE